MNGFSVWLRYSDGREEKLADSIERVQRDGRVAIAYGPQAEPCYVLGALHEIDILNRIIAIVPDLDDEGQPRLFGGNQPASRA
jgi:hypothetical protein